jgi:DNA helicase-2/ATP-dependent DNA helicase PcrA
LESHGRLFTGKPLHIVFPGAERLQKSKFDGDWEAHRQQLRNQGELCFDLFAPAIADLLNTSCEVRDLIADKFPMVIVDEFQDTDNDQWRMVRSLLCRSTVFCLADPDQRIFEYRENVDEHRIQHFVECASPKVFDLGAENHRSPTTGILAFADAVLRNLRPLPKTDDVLLLRYRMNMLDKTLHAATVWSFSKLRKAGVEHPTLAILCRSNPFLAKLSIAISEEHTWKETHLEPIAHDVVWDADLSAAAAAIIGSMLEWPNDGAVAGLARTLHAIADFYLIKNAERPSASAVGAARKFEDSAAAVLSGKEPRTKTANGIRERFACLVCEGDPVSDWRRARDLLNEVGGVEDVVREVRLVRMFRATDAIGMGLGTLWLELGSYEGAADLIRRILDRERLLSTERDPSGCVLMSLHKSKGKEFDGVILVEGRYESPFLNTRRETQPCLPSRRLLRVGITRARHLVTILQPFGSPDLVD